MDWMYLSNIWCHKICELIWVTSAIERPLVYIIVFNIWSAKFLFTDCSWDLGKETCFQIVISFFEFEMMHLPRSSQFTVQCGLWKMKLSLQWTCWALVTWQAHEVCLWLLWLQLQLNLSVTKWLLKHELKN